MLIVAIAWIYVVGLMALTETSVIAGIVTFLFYCVLPLGTVMYLAGSGRRRARRREQEAAARAARPAPPALATPDSAAGAATDGQSAPGASAKG